MLSRGKRIAPDLSAILEGLLQADVEFILVGGLAAVVQGAPVTTFDVDIVHNHIKSAHGSHLRDSVSHLT